MEYICEIHKNTKNLIFIANQYGIELPLFNLTTIPKYGSIGYMLYFLKEDKYSPNLIYIYPPKELTETQFKIINEKWNYCVEKDLDKLEFEI